VPDLKNLIDPAVCDLIRVVARRPLGEEPDEWWGEAVVVAEREGVFWPDEGPIRLGLRPNGRASCRECGRRIPIGALAVMFGVDTLGQGQRGHVVTAYIHASPLECARLLAIHDALGEIESGPMPTDDELREGDDA